MPSWAAPHQEPDDGLISQGLHSPATANVSPDDRRPAVAPAPVTQHAAWAAPRSSASRGSKGQKDSPVTGTFSSVSEPVSGL